MKYSITHRTTYRYSGVVHQSYHLLHLSPCAHPQQRILRHRITTEPKSELRDDLVDFFGNPYSILAMEEDHRTLVVEASSEIETSPVPVRDLGQTIDWAALAQSFGGGRSLTGNGTAPSGTTSSVGSGPGVKSTPSPIPRDVIQYAIGSRHAALLPSLAAYAAPSFVGRRPVLLGAQDLMRRIFEDFTFDSTATDISTPVETVLRNKRGVCQDFAHLMIAALRSLHLPARYVSGYIRTIPPQGQARLAGADASHAWVSVWAPETGWVDFDPTNNTIPHRDHITIAYGRDYDDVSPISGVLLGGGNHTVDVAVDVIANP